MNPAPIALIWKFPDDVFNLLPLILPILIPVAIWLWRRALEKQSSAEPQPTNALKRLDEAAGRSLAWVETQKFPRSYQLLADGDLFATMHWESIWKSRALAQAADARWALEHQGFFHNRVEISEAGSGAVLATFKSGWAGKGQLLLPDGRQFRWGRPSFWATDMAFRDERGSILLRYKTRLLSTGSQVLIEPIAFGMRELPLLVLLGWYLMDESRRRSS